MRVQKRSRFGEGRAGCVLWVAALLLFSWICWKAVPVKIQSAQLDDYMVELAKFSARAKPDDVKQQIVQRAEELGLPVTSRDVRVTRRGGNIIMEATYTVPLDFGFYVYQWTFKHLVDRPVFII